MKGKITGIALSGLILSTTQSMAVEINLPGISIDDKSVTVGVVSITEGDVVFTEGKTNSGEFSGREIINADHSRSNFEGNDLVGTRISGSNFSRSNLSMANLRGARISGSILSRANLTQVNIYGALISSSDFSRAKLGQVVAADSHIRNSDLSRANFDGADLSGVVFENSDLSRASFIGACLYGARFINSNFSRANFTDAVLTDTANTRSEFSRATMEKVDRVSSCGRTSGKTTQPDGWSSSMKTEIIRKDIAAASSILAALSTGENAKIDLTVNFAFNSDLIEGNAREQLREIGIALNDAELAGTAILIQGHTDSTGDASYNADLSNRRALRVMRILVDRYEIDRQRLAVEGMGEIDPIADNASDTGRAINRRVTLVNVGAQ